MPHRDARVAEIDLYVVDISVSAQRDSTAAQKIWTALAAPCRRIELLSKRQTRFALVSETVLPHDLYYALRVTIDTDSSVVRFRDGTPARVRWPVYGAHTSYARLDLPISVPDDGTTIVIDFDLEESLIRDSGDPIHDLRFTPAFWAVDATVTGGIHGTILGFTDREGTVGPIAGARVSVFRDTSLSSTEPQPRRALDHTDSTGYYSIDFLNPGPHLVRIEPPEPGIFGPVSASGLEIKTAEFTVFSVTLPRKSATGDAYWR